MNIQTVFVYVLIGIMVTFLSAWIMPRSRPGLAGELVAGVVGSFTGGWIFFQIGVYFSGYLWPLASAFFGALLLLSLLRIIAPADSIT